MGVILFLSTDTASAEHTGEVLLPLLRWFLPWASPGDLDAIHGLTRKGAHLTEYAILAALWYRAFTRGRQLASHVAGWLAFGISLAWAALDEWHQALVPSRTSSVVDIGIDGAGAAVALAVVCRGWRSVLDGTTTILLWLAAAGGTTAIAVNAWVGVPSGRLWVTTPAAAFVMVARHRLRRRKADAGAGTPRARVRP
jgi:VanZ family protein